MGENWYRVGKQVSRVHAARTCPPGSRCPPACVAALLTTRQLVSRRHWATWLHSSLRCAGLVEHPASRKGCRSMTGRTLSVLAPCCMMPLACTSLDRGLLLKAHCRPP